MTLRDRLDLEIIQIVVMTDDLLNGHESGINGTVADGDALQTLAVLFELNMCGRADDVAAVGQIADELISGRHLQSSAGNDCLKLAGVDRLFLSYADECVVDVRLVLGIEIVAQLANSAGNGDAIVVFVERNVFA